MQNKCAPGWGHILPQDFYMNNFGRSPLDRPKIKSLGLLVSDKKVFKVFPNMGLCKTTDPWGKAILDPKAVI